jgi:hypothetical protein
MLPDDCACAALHLAQAAESKRGLLQRLVWSYDQRATRMGINGSRTSHRVLSLDASNECEGQHVIS